MERLIDELMVRRSRSKPQTLEMFFPIRVHVAYDPRALPGLLEAVERWGKTNLGRGRMAAMGRATSNSREWTLYFRSFSEAQQCFAEFDELQLRDWVSQTDLEKETTRSGGSVLG